jgi:hypothetical protein
VLSSFRLFLILAIVVSALGTVGCSTRGNSNRPKVVHAGGVVRFNGQPLADALVTFVNPTANVSAHARTDANGRFTLTTFEQGDGAVPGQQQVSVIKAQAIGHVDPNVDRTTTVEKSNPQQWNWLIPEKYSNTTTSGLTAEIGDGGNKDLVVELTGEAGGEPGKKPPAKPPAGVRPDR